MLVWLHAKRAHMSGNNPSLTFAAELGKRFQKTPGALLSVGVAEVCFKVGEGYKWTSEKVTCALKDNILFVRGAQKGSTLFVCGNNNKWVYAFYERERGFCV